MIFHKRNYRFNDEIFKIYKKFPDKYTLSLEDVEKLSKIHTERILMPKKPIFDEKFKFCGHTEKAIDAYHKENLKRMNMGKFIEELFLLKKDLLTLNYEQVEICDLNYENYIYSDGIYIIDPGSYKILSSRHFSEILNQVRLNEFVINDILLRITKLSSAQKEKIIKHFPIGEYISDVLEYDIDPTQTVLKYIKSIV